MVVRWCANDGPKFDAGLVACVFSGFQTSIAKKTYILRFFSNCSDPLPPPPSGSVHDFRGSTGVFMLSVIYESFIWLILSLFFKQNKLPAGRVRNKQLPPCPSWVKTAGVS